MTAHRSLRVRVGQGQRIKKGKQMSSWKKGKQNRRSVVQTVTVLVVFVSKLVGADPLVNMTVRFSRLLLSFSALWVMLEMIITLCH